MVFKVTGIKALENKLKQRINRLEKATEINRFAVAHDLTLEIMKWTPVWSGRAMTSILWSNGDVTSPGIQWNGEYGRTNSMELGEEPARPWAEDRVMNRLRSLDFKLDKPVVLTLGATHWPLVNWGRAPDGERQRKRNKAGSPVLETAIAITKALYQGRLRLK